MRKDWAKMYFLIVGLRFVDFPIVKLVECLQETQYGKLQGKGTSGQNSTNLSYVYNRAHDLSSLTAQLGLTLPEQIKSGKWSSLSTCSWAQNWRH